MAPAVLLDFHCTVVDHKELVTDLTGGDDERHETDLIFRSFRNTAGGVARNRSASALLEIERDGGSFEDVRDLVAGTRGRKVYENGDPDAGIWSAGLCQGLIHDIPTCAELVERLVTESDAIIAERLAGMAGLLAPVDSAAGP